MLVSDGYSALARANDRDLIAALPDNLFGDTLLYEEPMPVALNDVQVWPLNDKPMQMVERNGWLTITPPFPTEARSRRADRSALGRIFRRVAHRGSWRTEDIAEIVANSGNAAYEHFAIEYFGPSATAPLRLG